MRRLGILFHMARADFLERSRSYSFLILLCLAIYLGYAINTGQIVLRFNTCAEIFNSAWVGVMMAIAINFFLGFFGFYLVKGSIERDACTGVGQIMAATPMQRVEYTFGKWFSHFIVLSILVVILAVETVIIQTYRSDNLNLLVLVSPFLWLTLPFMALVSGIAVLFETVPLIRGNLSNVIYFFLFVFLVVSVTSPSRGHGLLLSEPSGIGILLDSVKSAGLDCGGQVSRNDLKTLPSPGSTSAGTGIPWSSEILLSRLSVVVVAMLATFVSAMFFNRFDTSKESLPRKRASKIQERIVEDEENSVKHVEESVHLTPLTGNLPYQNNLFRIMLSEIRLMFKGNHWVWYAGGAALWVLTLTASRDKITLWLIVAAVWPLLIWSKMGIRETYYRTNQIVFSCARPLFRLLFASWLAGMLVTAALWSGAGIHFAVHGQMANLAGLIIAILLVPSFALMLGVWTGSSKVFEVSYLVIWYAGIANRMPSLDFMGLTQEAVIIQHPGWMLIILAIFVLLLLLGRQKQLQV